MATVQGIKERLHQPLYDGFEIEEGESLEEAISRAGDPRLMRFFMDVTNKTRLETNLQASGVLPSNNEYEVRALRVVISNKTRNDLPQNGSSAANRVAAVDLASSKLELFVADFIYQSVTRLVVGEKIMIEAPTWYFPAGAGVSPGGDSVSNGNPDPMATLRIAEPVMIDPSQNFRVEVLFPQGLQGTLQKPAEGSTDPPLVSGPMRIWVTLDGYMTRDVQ